MKNRNSNTNRKDKNKTKSSGIKKVNKLNVGVTLFISGGSQTIWDNGIYQNVGFLIMLLNRSKIVEKVFLVNGGPGDARDKPDIVQNAPAPIINMAEAMDELDVIIELSAQIDPEWATDFKHRGGTVIGMRVANDYILDAERMAYGLEPGMLFSKVPYDVIWTLPAFAKTCESYYRVGFGAPVRVLQHLWSSALLDRSAEENKRPFHYKGGSARWRIAILEPNICTVKTCHLPLMIADAAYKRNCRAIEHVYTFNALDLKNHETFINFAKSLKIVQHGIGTFEGRLPIYQVMNELADACVSHHWENGQNYLYYELLYGGFPLIHNSDFLGGCGYRYEQFNPEDGATALLRAKAEHDLNISSYKNEAKEFLNKLDPLYDLNIKNYEDEILYAITKGNKSDLK